MFLDRVEYLDHMTDAYLRIRGQTMKEAFEYSAMGLVNITNRFTLLTSKSVKIDNTQNNFTVLLPLIKKMNDKSFNNRR